MGWSVETADPRLNIIRKRADTSNGNSKDSGKKMQVLPRVVTLVEVVRNTQILKLKDITAGMKSRLLDRRNGQEEWKK